MDQYGSMPPMQPPGPPTPSSFPPHGAPGPRPMPQQPQVLHVVARPGAFSWAIGWLIAAVAIGIIFLVGLFFGVIAVLAGSPLDRAVVPHHYRDGSAGSTIAIIPVVGLIEESQSHFIHACVDHVLHDTSVVAAVLRVDSPGGMVAPSDQIWNEVERLKKANIRVVASYGGLAASGGYYVSCGADAIVAEETCITGSIGVIAQILTLDGLMDKVGINPVTIVATHSPEKNTANDIFRAWNEHDKEKIQAMLDSAYDIFRTRVADGRKTTIDATKLDAIANGSIFTARQAKDNGLIDAIGYLEDAITKAEQLAGVPTGGAYVTLLQPPPSLFGSGMLLKERSSQAEGLLNADRLRALASDLASPRVMYLMR